MNKLLRAQVQCVVLVLLLFRMEGTESINITNLTIF